MKLYDCGLMSSLIEIIGDLEKYGCLKYKSETRFLKTDFHYLPMKALSKDTEYEIIINRVQTFLIIVLSL